jgi:hypothetical protein
MMTAVVGSHGEMERPHTLELPMTPRTPLRSSLKKSSITSSTSSYRTPGTTTPTTPPDYDDHPKTSDSGFASTSRVRFSPSPFDKTSSASGSGNVAFITDWSPTHVDPPHPLHAQQQQTGQHLARQTSSERPVHYITENDLKRDFNLFQ